MELRREREADTDLGDAARHLVGPEIDAHPERLERVGPARQRRRGPVAVLDHRYARGGHHDRGHGGQVHGVGAVTAGADHVDGVVADRGGRHPARVLEHDVGQLGHLRRASGRFIFIDTAKPAIWAGVATPVMIWSIAQAACPGASA